MLEKSDGSAGAGGVCMWDSNPLPYCRSAALPTTPQLSHGSTSVGRYSVEHQSEGRGFESYAPVVCSPVLF